MMISAMRGYTNREQLGFQGHHRDSKKNAPKGYFYKDDRPTEKKFRPNLGKGLTLDVSKRMMNVLGEYYGVSEGACDNIAITEDQIEAALTNGVICKDTQPLENNKPNNSIIYLYKLLSNNCKNETLLISVNDYSKLGSMRIINKVMKFSGDWPERYVAEPELMATRDRKLKNQGKSALAISA